MPLLCYQFKNQIFRGKFILVTKFILIMKDLGDEIGMAW